MQRPTITSSLTFSITQAASPATRASRTGALYKFQNKKSSPRDAVVLPTWPNKLAVGSQKMRSKHNTTWKIEEKITRLNYVSRYAEKFREKNKFNLNLCDLVSNQTLFFKLYILDILLNFEYLIKFYFIKFEGASILIYFKSSFNSK